MQAGKLRNQFAIYYPVESQNDFGEPEAAWQFLVTSWGDYREVRSSEAFAAEQMQGKQFLKVRMRYLPTISTKMRVQTADGKWWLIRGVAPIGGGTREIDLTLEEFTDG